MRKIFDSTVLKYKLENPHGIYVDEEKSIRGMVASFPLKEGRAAIRERALMIGPDWAEVERVRNDMRRRGRS